MPHRLTEARNLANALRFCKDAQSNSMKNYSLRDFDNIKNVLYKTGMEITEVSTLYLGKCISDIKTLLKIPQESVKTFVYSSPEIQAECFLGSENECILRLTSGIVNLLSIEELKFVIGHEIGHFLLGHSGVFEPEQYWQSQSQEISADRVGLLCAGSLDVAFRALLKTTSGLDERHLTFNVSEFISQMKKFLEVANIKNNQSTHPSMVLRSRALIWFSASDFFLNYPEDHRRFDVKSVDSKVMNDFDKEIRIVEELEKQNVKNDLHFWTIAEYIFNLGKFTKESQKTVEKVLSTERMNKLKSLLSNFSPDEIKNEIQKNSESIETILLQSYAINPNEVKKEFLEKIYKALK
ncbi:M48 family metallopeptidase [Halobacteriovorax sp. GB3]|uniref:M48 family metallopeptidase n=1 Tax=Halobacteriovorax sp. GB3 TaxID=2719615 RepID=UPI00235FDB52|nr:M48 family metallopeptidase [Halobacteriovorax sp. GB3]MDD0854275.1 M48 family metallopeptidase [Halobacteriovorax sp. GB3]